ncbi:MAG: hypothetical protein V3W08_05310, partial [Candidatus Binatia bacterium]
PRSAIGATTRPTPATQNIALPSPHGKERITPAQLPQGLRGARSGLGGGVRFPAAASTLLRTS